MTSPRDAARDPCPRRPAVPDALRQNTVGSWGARGSQWLARLPHTLDEVARTWGLVVGAPYPLTYHWVAPVTRADGSPAVLKLGIPDGHLGVEARTLRAYGGEGAVRLLAFDAGHAAMLVERALPGTPLSTLVPQRDQDATAVLIDLGRRLHRRVGDEQAWPDLRASGRSFRRHLDRFPGDDLLPRHLVEAAAALFDELCASAPEQVLLHGDLHHDNVLRAGDRWLAIDPHGVIGDPGYDCAATLYNPSPVRHDEQLLDLVPARVEQLADGFEIPPERVSAWGFVMAVLSEIWTVAGGGTPGSRALDVAMLLHQRLP